MTHEMFIGSKGRFVEIRCEDCGNTQIIFNKASTEIKCLVCDAKLATPTGGVAKFYGTIIGEIV